LKVLIAEDDAVSRTVLERTVEKLGHECLATEDGQIAWRTYQDTPEVDVIISDWMMPNMDGLELCHKIRGLDRDDYTFFIFLTALGARSTSSRASRPALTSTSPNPSTPSNCGQSSSLPRA
jgi:CheY-like chemotaxis protein